MATWRPALSSCLLLFVLVVLPSVDSASVTSSRDINRDFRCRNGYQNAFRPPCPYKTEKLYIQGFVPATNEVFNSETIIPAAYAAIDDVNADCSLLGNYSLQLDFVNTLCDPSEATWQLIDSIVLQMDQENQPKITFLGGGCSLATEPVAALAGRFYNIPQISYGASSPSLSERNLFPRFIRTIPSENQANRARFALMNRNNWTKVATLHETQTIFSLAVEDFNDLYDRMFKSNESSSNEEDEDHVLRSFTDDPAIPLSQIMEKDIRIIFGYFYEDKAVNTLCQAYRMNLTTPTHLWMFPAWFTPGWWDTDEGINCTRAEMREAVRGSFFLDSHLYGINKDEVTETGTRTANEFDEKYACYLEEFRANNFSGPLTVDSSPEHIYRTFAYDAVWTNALALNMTNWELAMMREDDPNFNLTLASYEYFDKNNISEMISRFMGEISFTGVSGRVSFDKYGTRMGLNAIYQLVPNASDPNQLDLVLLAVHDPAKEGSTDVRDFNLDFEYIVNPIYKSGSNPPSDRRTPKNLYMNSALVIVCCVVAAMAIVVGIALFIFNLVTICKPLIRDSAPLINAVVIIGCIWMLVTCFLLSIDSNNPPVDSVTHMPDEMINPALKNARDHRYKIICILRLWFLTIGFTLSFGALFAKTWQFYRVYTNPKLQKEPFKMWNFLIIMGIFLTIDIAYLIFWTAAYPFRRGLNPVQDDSEDLLNIHEVCQCDNYPYLIGALYVYKGLLVVFGLFLAYESRNVKYYYINDSRYVSIAMYIVVILVGIGAPLSLVLAVHFFTDAAYSLAIFMVVASCLSCMLILFVPKFVFMARGKDTMVRENEREEITVSDGVQLGRMTIDQTEVNSAEDKVDKLKQENAKKERELRQLEDEVIVNGEELGVSKPRMIRGSDGDSGVLVTVDEGDEVFSTESTGNGESSHHPNTPSPTSIDSVPEQVEEA